MARQLAVEHCTDLQPSPVAVFVPIRQGPHPVQMIGQHHDRIDPKRPRLLRYPECKPQYLRVLHQQAAVAITKMRAEEVRAAGLP